MRKVLSKFYDSSPRELFEYAESRLRFNKSPSKRPPSTKPDTASVGRFEEVYQVLQSQFAIYTTANLNGISAEEFRKSIQSRIGTVDAQSEGYADDQIHRQRDLSIKFHWGHDHDFGDFRVKGMMGDRHISLLADFITLFPVSLDDIKGKDVFDIGCWTGGTTLLLATLAKQVISIEEVNKYAETASFLSQCFGMDDRAKVKPLSIYECNHEEFHDQFDVVYFPGVIYHLSDPLLGLRILFNSMKPGGIILVESAGINTEEPYCRFDGSLVPHSGTKAKLNRAGWNWFMPSPSALHRMMMEAGFEDIQTRWYDKTDRVYGFGKKLSQADICRAGLSVKDIR